MNPFAMGRQQNSVRDDTLCLRMVGNAEVIRPHIQKSVNW
jgi:hypothetical protein